MVNFVSTLALLALSGLAVHASPPSFTPRGSNHAPKSCPPFKGGDFVVDYFQLYPENADWDPVSCSILFGAVWNATVGIYNPYAPNMTQVLEYPGVSHTGDLHIGGLAWDPFTGLYTILTDPAAAWATGGADVSGTHLLMKYNPLTKQTLWTLNISTVSHERYGGFQDVETDRRGNTYVVGTWPGTILRADKRGKAIKEWHVPRPLAPTTQKGFGGLALVPESDILLSNDGDGQIYRFDTRDEVGRPVLVPMRPRVLYADGDAIYLPPRYGGSVLLLASHLGGIQVLRSKDRKWTAAEYLGTVPNRKGPLYEGGVVVAAVEVGKTPGSIYMIEGFWDAEWVPGTVAGNRTRFPMPDITREVEALLRK
ncbi:hypothetical protein B0T18DRAFT_367179 [Schizothecium vesticola]|uniref:TRI14-like protein n=1 Tax=Schizothecium vesticola TaxID=314040 RepID=A0AA40ETY3_9PEZI|nr:hypothetical protein B0T18DRAFT_367179 [Schizothecium vesticola]